MQTRFALILYFLMMTHKAACHTLSKAFLINEDMLQILLMLEVLCTQDSKVEDMFYGTSLRSSIFRPKIYWRCTN